jgi:hypothetical protein
MKLNKGKKYIQSLEKKMKKRNMEQNTDVETVNVVERLRPEDEEQVDLQDQIG